MEPRGTQLRVRVQPLSCWHLFFPYCCWCLHFCTQTVYASLSLSRSSMILSQLNLGTPIHPLGISHMSVIIHVVWSQSRAKLWSSLGLKPFGQIRAIKFGLTLDVEPSQMRCVGLGDQKWKNFRTTQLPSFHHKPPEVSDPESRQTISLHCPQTHFQGVSVSLGDVVEDAGPSGDNTGVTLRLEKLPLSQIIDEAWLLGEENLCPEFYRTQLC